MCAQTALGCIPVSVCCGAGAPCMQALCRLNVPASVRVTCTRTAAHQQAAAAQQPTVRPAVCFAVAVVADVVDVMFPPSPSLHTSDGFRPTTLRVHTAEAQITQVGLLGKLSCEWRSLAQHNAAHFSFFFLSPLLPFLFFLSLLP